MATKCPKCHFENPEDTFYCGKCATPLPSSKDISVSQTETLQAPIKELTTGSTFAGRYQIIEELGKGGMGRVYKAFDTEIKEKIGLKLLKPELGIDEETIERFRNELRFARKIGHRNVCKMFDLNKAEGVYYITMEYVPGEDLKRLIRKVEQLPTGKTISIAKQVCQGLAEAHSQGIVHRDLKPQNIMVDEAGNAKIMDFGIARSLAAKGITGAAVMIGTPEYMSPEQVEGREVDERSDIYSLGIILYEMVTGKVPFEGDTPFTIGVKHKSEAPKSPRELNTQIPEDLSQLILRCLAKEKEKRYQNTGEIAAELERIEQGLPTTERIVPERRPFTSREITVKFNVKKVAIPAALVALIIMAAIVIWQLRPHKKIAPLPLSAKPSLAVMYFENHSGEQDLDKVLVDMLTTNLSRNEQLEVMSSQRLFDILNELGKPAGTSIDRTLATRIATRAGAQTMLMGSIIKIGEKIRITSQLSNVRDGALIASEQVDGNKVEDVFRMVDELTEKVSGRLGLSATSVQQQSIADVTTSSYEAYRHYQKGLEHLWKWRFEEAEENFKKATEIDPTFASAYSSLAISQSRFSLNTVNPFFDISAIKETMNLAKKYSDRATEKERLSIDIFSLFVEGDYERGYVAGEALIKKYPQDKNGYIWLGNAAFITRDLEKAKDNFEKALEIDPTDGNSYNMLAYALSRMNDHPRAISTVKKYIAVHPDSTNSYDSAWEISVLAGLYDEGLAFLEEAKKRFPDIHVWHGDAGETYLLMGEAARAREEFLRYAALDSSASVAQTRNVACCYLLDGRYEEAEREFRKAVELAQQKNQGELYSRLELGKMLALQKKFDGAVEIYRETMDLSRNRYKDDFNPIQVIGHSLIGTALVRKGDMSAAQAQADELGRILKGGNYRHVHRDYLHYLTAEILLAQKKFEAAQNETENVMLWAKSVSPVYRKLKAEILALQGNSSQAIETYEQSFTRNIASAGSGVSDSFCFFLGRSLVDYDIAKIHEQTGDKIKAREHYQKFLDLMKKSDPGIPEVEDARQRLEGLKGQ